MLLLKKKIKNCNYQDCKTAIFEKEHSVFECILCSKLYCNHHLTPTKYIDHLVDPVLEKCKKSPGFICIDCFKNTQFSLDEWSRCLFDRKCAIEKCSTSIDDWHSRKILCGVCGKWFCWTHSKPLKTTQSSWRVNNVQYTKAEYICAKCSENVIENSWFEEIASKIFDKGAKKLKEASDNTIYKVGQKTKETYLGYGLRIALTMIFSTFVFLLLPQIKKSLHEKEIFQLSWKALTLCACLYYFLHYFIFPSLRIAHLRKLLIWLIISFLGLVLIYFNF